MPGITFRTAVFCSHLGAARNLKYASGMLCRRCEQVSPRRKAPPTAPVPDVVPVSPQPDDAEEMRCSRCGTQLWLDKESQLARFGLFALRRPGWARLRAEDAD